MDLCGPSLVERLLEVLIERVKTRGMREGAALPLRLWDPASTPSFSSLSPLARNGFHPPPPQLDSLTQQGAWSTVASRVA